MIDYNALVMETLPSVQDSPEACGKFLRVFRRPDNMFRLSPECIEALRTADKEGNPFAAYALGRWNVCTQAEDSSAAYAVEYMLKAYNAGLVEACVALALMYNNGDFGCVNWQKGLDLLDMAMQTGNEYAAEVHARMLLYGMFGQEPDPQRALEFIESHMTGDFDPFFHYLKGCAVQQLEGSEASAPYFRTAAENGVPVAWGSLAAALAESEEYDSVLLKGCEEGDGLSMSMLALERIMQYDGSVGDREEILDILEQSMILGEPVACETMGDVYAEGLLDAAVNYEDAWSWYSLGVLYHGVGCCEKLVSLYREGKVEARREMVDMVVLMGARLGSRELTELLADIYSDGRLGSFADEIEGCWLPKLDVDFDSEDDNDDTPDDDGRFDAWV